MNKNGENKILMEKYVASQNDLKTKDEQFLHLLSQKDCLIEDLEAKLQAHLQVERATSAIQSTEAVISEEEQLTDSDTILKRFKVRS